MGSGTNMADFFDMLFEKPEDSLSPKVRTEVERRRKLKNPSSDTLQVEPTANEVDAQWSQGAAIRAKAAAA